MVVNRRGFLRALYVGAGAVVAVPLLPFLPKPPPAMRFVSRDVADPHVFRFDVLYGYGKFDPGLACRITA
jgi:hypothetical protein